MAHKRRRQRNRWECGHQGLGKYCHFCKDKQAGRPVGIKKKRAARAGTGSGGAPEGRVRIWKRARCPFCKGSRVKKNDLNVMSALDAKEFTCKEFKCGKEFNEDQVKAWDEIQVPG